VYALIGEHQNRIKKMKFSEIFAHPPLCFSMHDPIPYILYQKMHLGRILNMFIFLTKESSFKNLLWIFS